MKVYFLVEGRRTEPIVYRHWFRFLLPELEEVQGFDDVQQQNYFLRGAYHRSPSFRDRLEASIREANQCNYDYLIICIDAEDRTVDEVRNGINEIVAELDADGISLNDHISLDLVVQNKCIETWFLGNRKVFPRTPQNPKLVEYIQHFDVYLNDPELMSRPARNNTFESDAQFHFDYFRTMLSERNLTYSKRRPGSVVESYYLEQLKRRVQESEHLNSLRYLFDLCEHINHQPVNLQL